MTTICCVCKKTKTKKRWEDRAISANLIISHGYCPVCYKDALSKMAKYIEN